MLSLIHISPPLRGGFSPERFLREGVRTILDVLPLNRPTQRRLGQRIPVRWCGCNRENGMKRQSLQCPKTVSYTHLHTPLVWARLCMTSDAAWDTKAYFDSGRALACDPMSNSPPARKRRCRKLLFCPGTAQKTEASRALDFRFRLRFSSRNRHRAKRRKLPAHIAPLRAALTCLVLSKVGTSE